MVTIRALNTMLESFYDALTSYGFQPDKLVLFGSYAKGTARPYSDIDVAIWNPRFTGSIALDMEAMASIKRDFPMIEIHTFTSRDSETSNPFIEEIMKDGKEWSLGVPIQFY